MKKFFTLLLAAACFTATAQSDIDYPYNPDFENDGFVGIEDVLELLSVYGTPFTPEQLLLDGSSLTEIIESLQSQIDSLASYTNEGFGAIALNDSLLTEYLVGVAAASEEGDSTLGAWVMQLSELVEQQQGQIDSLLNIEVFEAEDGDPFFVDYVIDGTIFISGTPTVVEVNADWSIPPQWRLYGINQGGSSQTIYGVATEDLASEAQNFSNLYTVYPDWGLMKVRLDSCASDEVLFRFQGMFDFQASKDFGDSLFQVIEDPFEFDLRPTPEIRIMAYPQPPDVEWELSLFRHSMFAFGLVYDGNNGNGWQSGYQEWNGNDEGYRSVIRLSDGSWVPK